MINPVPRYRGLNPTISDGFRDNRADHNGVDLMFRRPQSGSAALPEYSKHYFMPNGHPAVAIDHGVVREAKQIGTGGYVVIDHPNGLTTQYMHLRNLRVRAGDRVIPGKAVGDISHNVSGYRLNHLHFQMRRNGALIDPEPLLRVATIIDAPVTFPVLGFALSIAAGYLAYRYLFT
jgi:murein DD-endopeptidase MepM/ murein hydrolase activator NlpD